MSDLRETHKKVITRFKDRTEIEWVEKTPWWVWFLVIVGVLMVLNNV